MSRARLGTTRAGRAGRSTNLLSFVTGMELLYQIERDEGREAARTAIRLPDAARVEWVSCEPGSASVRSRLAGS